MSGQEMDLEAFLGHRRSDGGGGKFAENWKKRKPPIIDTWINTRSAIAALWQHGQPAIVEWVDKETKEKRQMVFSRQFTCWEDELILKAQYKRDDDTGRRLKPPVVCPDCLLQEWTREQIDAGELDWCAPMFRYDARDNDDGPTIIHAGGMLGLFGKRDPSPEEVKQMRAAKIRPSEAWKENQISKLYYVFAVADNDKPENGVCVHTVANLLGDKVKEVIHKAIMDAEDEGNPFKHPYCIRWMHRPDEKEFNKKYDACKMGKIQMTDQIRQLIVTDDPPSMARTLARGNPLELKAQLQDACLVKGVPWDAIFGRAIKQWEAKEGKEGSRGDGTNFDPDELDEPAPRTQSAVRAKKDASPCEECGDLIPQGARECPGCHVPVALVGDALPY